MSLVVDTSATLAWVYSEETTEAISEVLARLTDRGAWVPALWRLEVANVLEMNVRRGRHDAAFRDAAQRRRLPLATLDKELRDAATAEGVILLGKST